MRTLMFSPPKISQSLAEILDSLCTQCPKENHTEHCPFAKLQLISREHRMSLFLEMDMGSAPDAILL